MASIFHVPCRLIVVLAAAGLIVGCATKTPQPRASSTQPVVLPILQELAGVDGPYPRPINLVIRDEPTLYKANLGELKVDFTKEMVLLVALGKVSNTAYRVQITEVREERDVVLVQTKMWVPTKDIPGEAGVAFPWCAVVVPCSTLNVDRFETNADRITHRGYNPFR